MFQIRLMIIAAALLLLGIAGANSGLTGKKAPHFKLKTLEGGSIHTPEDFKGQVLLLDFWASWCPPCKVSLPELQRMDEAYKGLKVVTINIDDDAANAKKFMKKHGLSMTTLFDEKKEVVEAYGVEAMPTAVIIDKKGVVRKVMSGYTIKKKEELESTIKSLLK